MADIKHVRKLLEKATSAGGFDEETIHEAERKMGVRFPQSYRTFLSEYGAVVGTPYEMTGMSNDDVCVGKPPTWWDVVMSTLQMRCGARGRLPHEYVLIAHDGGDFKFYLDTSRLNAQGECPVVVRGPGADGIVVAEDFFDFLSRSFEGSLSF